MNKEGQPKGAVTLLIVADRETLGPRDRVADSIRATTGLKVGLSRLKITRIRQEIKPQSPNLILITAILRLKPEEARREEVNDLCGFIKKTKKHLPQTKIVLSAPQLREDEEKIICVAGLNAWISEQVPWQALGPALESLATGRGVWLSPLIQPGQVKTY